MAGVLYYFALVLAAVSGALLLPAASAAFYGESIAIADFIMTAALTAVVSITAAVALTGRERRLAHANGYILLLLVWCVVPLVAAVPIALVADVSPVDAFFEAVSGLTTTGATVLSSLDTMPKSVLFWRAELQWIGGFLTLLSIIFILAPFGVGGLPDRHIRLLSASDQEERGRVGHLALDTAAAYGIVSLACFVGLIALGTPIFDAFCLTFSTVSTGGFMPRDGNLSVYGSAALELWLALFMLIGATSIIWHRMLVQRRIQLLRAHRESYYVVGSAALLGLIYAAVLFHAAGSSAVLSPFVALREGIVTAASLVSTTGFETRDGGFAVLPLPMVLMVIFIGGGAFSTAGGIKFYRFGGMLVQSVRDLTRLVYPHGIRPARFGSQPYDIQLMKAIWSHLVVTVVLLGVMSQLVAIEAVDYEAALLAAASAFSNIGPVYETAWSAGLRRWQLFADFGPLPKMVLAFTMIIGRIEILALLGAINGLVWLRR